MAVETPCQTPGAFFHISIQEEAIVAAVSFKRKIPLTPAEAEVLEANIHNALELVLAPYFRTKTDP